MSNPIFPGKIPAGESLAKYAEIDIIATMQPMNARQRFWLYCLLAVCLWGLACFIRQCFIGLSATAMTNYFSWGVYIINFVFFIGISHAGTLVSAILRVTGADWRRPITRMAEGITVFALMIGAPMIIIDMGRPDRLLNVIIHGRLQSPILWDVCSVTTYISGSLMYLYIPMIPDMAILRDHSASFAPWRRKLYTFLAIGYTGTANQKRRLHRAIAAMSVVIIPVAVSVHTVVSWIFGMTLRAGWHSTIFGPYFVVGAIFSGIAALLTAMAIFVWYFKDQHLGRYITLDHFKKLASLLLAVNIIYIYFTLAEYLTMGYLSEGPDKRLLDLLFSGQYAIQFWIMAVIGLFIPAIMLALPWTRTFKGIVFASILINIGMWIKRYIIVVPTLASPFMPVLGDKKLTYVPTFTEWSITAAAFAGFSMLYLLFAKVFPIVSIYELEEGEEEDAKKAVETLRSTHPALLASPAIAGTRSILWPALAVIGLLAVTSSHLSAATAPIAGPACATCAAGTDATTKPTAPASVSLTLAVVTEDNQKTIQATVINAGKPVEGATVHFTVKRTFGKHLVGDDKTLDDGTAGVKFPTNLPGDSTGQLVLLADVMDPPAVAGAHSELVFASALPAKAAEEDPFPRALWSPHVPYTLIATLAILFGGVWTTYLFVVRQIIGIMKGD
jgi:molybdopterin-containing oxidoreductase family membrane subunit